MIDKKLLEILVCPLCKEKFSYSCKSIGRSIIWEDVDFYQKNSILIKNEEQ